MNIDKARSAVEHIARQLANAMDAVDRCDTRIEQARKSALDAVHAKVSALDEVDRLQAEFVAAEATLLECQTTLGQTNGAASGSAINPTIRTD